MKKFTLAFGFVLLFCITLTAQEKKKKWWEDIKQNTTFGGYVVGKAAFNDQDLDAKNESHTTFDIRMVRAYVNGKLWDFKYGLQMEMSGVAGGSSEKGPRVIDAWAEWCKYDFFMVKFGQFKRGFTFENPMNPWDVGYGANSQVITKLAGMNDRVGEHLSGGRDLGIQLQGNLFKSQKDGHHFFHYHVGAYNGQGINHADRNNTKDIIGGVWVTPVKNLSIGAFGWTGDYSKDVNGKKVTVDRNRLSYGIKYEDKWTVRAEYVQSQGHKIADYTISEQGDVTVKGKDKSDGWYAMLGVPVTDKCKIYGKWDVYRDQKNKATQKSIYALAVNFYIYKNMKIQGLYSFVDDNSYAGDKHYNTAEIQLYWRF